MFDNVLITGATGMLGASLRKAMPHAQFLNGRRDLDMTDLDQVRAWFENKKFDTIIHTAANTNLSDTDSTFESKMNIHSNIIPIMANSCNHIVYISTVPLWEKDTEDLNEYFVTKFAGEMETLSTGHGTVIRTNIYGEANLIQWAYDNLNHGECIRGYTDSWFNPVHVDQLSDCLMELVQDFSGGSKILSVAGDTVLSKFDFLHNFAKVAGLNEQLILPFDRGMDEDLVIEDPNFVVSFEEGLEFLGVEYADR